MKRLVSILEASRRVGMNKKIVKRIAVEASIAITSGGSAWRPLLKVDIEELNRAIEAATTKVCVVCGVEFRSKRKTDLACSRHCQREHQLAYDLFRNHLPHRIACKQSEAYKKQQREYAKLHPVDPSVHRRYEYGPKGIARRRAAYDKRKSSTTYKSYKNNYNKMYYESNRNAIRMQQHTYEENYKARRKELNQSPAMKANRRQLQGEERLERLHQIAKAVGL